MASIPPNFSAIHIYFLGPFIGSLFKYMDNLNRKVLEQYKLRSKGKSLKHTQLPYLYPPYKYILTICYQLSSFFIRIPLNYTKSPTISNILLTNFIAYFGIPQHIFTDSGSNLDLLQSPMHYQHELCASTNQWKSGAVP